MGLHTFHSSADNRVTISIAGRFDFNLQREFREAYESIRDQRVRYVVDLNGTDYMDSSALGMLLLLREHESVADKRIAIVNCSKEIQQILNISNFHQLFDVRGRAA